MKFNLVKVILIFFWLGFICHNSKSQNTSFELAMKAYYEYDYSNSITLFNNSKNETNDRRVQLKGDAFKAISNIYLGDYQEAINTLSSGFADATTLYGETSLEISDYYLGFGKYYEVLEIYDTALIFNNAALAIKQNYLPANHKDFIDVYVNMGIAYDYTGLYDSAIYYYKKGLDITIENLGKIHSYTEYLYNDMGVVYGFMEQHEQALKMAQEAFEVRSKLYGESSFEVAQSYHNMAVSLDALTRYSEALSNYKKALDLKQKLFDEKSIEMAGAYYSLGNSYSRNNEFQQAILNNKKAYDIASTIDGKYGKLILKYLKNLGNVCFDGGLYSNAVNYYKEYVRSASESDVSNKELAEMHLYLGEAYENNADYRNAELSFNAALDNYEDDDTDIYHVFISLARIKDLQSDYKESLRLLNEALKVTGENSPKAGLIYNNMSLVYIHISDYEKAKICIDKSLNIRIKHFDIESVEVSQVYSTLGNYFSELQNFGEALKYYQKAYEIKRKNYPENHPLLTKALFNLSTAYGNNGSFNKEIDLLKMVLKNNEQNFGKDYSGNTSVYLNFCLVYDRQGKKSESLKYGNLAVELNIKDHGDQSEQTADALSALAVAQHNFAEEKEALKNNERALFIYESLLGKKHLKTANQYNNLGVVFMDGHEYEKAKTYFNQALEVYEYLFGKRSSHYVSTLSNLALIEYQRSEYGNAIRLFNESLKLGQNLDKSYKPTQATTFQNLGLSYSFDKQPEKAIIYFSKALKIRENVLGKDHYEAADIMINIGNYYLAKTDYDSAEYYFQNAGDIYNKYYANKGKRIANAFNNLASLYLQKHEYEMALKYNKQSLDANSTNDGAPNSFSEAFVSHVTASDINYLLYRKNHDKTYLNDAHKNASKADELLSEAEQELLREDDKLTFSIYKTLLTNIAIKNAKALYLVTNDPQYFDKALYFAERSKSGVLLSALRLSNVKQFGNVDNDLITKEKSLLNAIQKTKQEFFKLSDSSDKERTIGQRNKLFDLQRELEIVNRLIQERFPKHLAINNQSIVSLTSLQANLEDRSGTAYIEYAISDSTLHAIVITSNEKAILSSSLDEKFENKLRVFRKAVMFKAHNVLNLVSEEIYNIVFKQVEEFFLKNQLDINNVVIVPESSLNYLPYEALFRNQDGKHEYLIENYSVSYNYSLSLFDFIRNRKAEPTSNSCLAFAPVFSELASNAKMNEESKELYTVASNTMADVSRAFTRDGAFISALPGTETEVKAIYDIAESSGIETKYFIYEEAKEEVIKSGILKDHKYLHFATHGFINEDDPAFSGILMSQNSNGEEDCILYASEIYNLEINADLVTLSACETGLGKMAFGEGIVGLSRSFLYAGASNLLVSQWKVNDESTSNMMVDFYDKVLSGKSKSQSLREAKLNILKNSKFKNPYYWAPFVLIGE